METAAVVVVLRRCCRCSFWVASAALSSRPAMRASAGWSHGSSTSLLWALFGIGALATPTAGPVLSRRRPGVVNGLRALVRGVVMLPVAVVHDVLPAAVLFLVGGAIWGPYTTIETGARQRWVSPARLGAVAGLLALTNRDLRAP